MAKEHRGKRCVMRVGATALVQIKDFTLSIAQTAIDGTYIGNDWKHFLDGSRSGTWTGNMFLDMGDPGLRGVVDVVIAAESGMLGDLRFEMEEGAVSNGYFYGSCVVTKIDPKNPGNDGIIEAALAGTFSDRIWYVEAV